MCYLQLFAVTNENVDFSFFLNLEMFSDFTENMTILKKKKEKVHVRSAAAKIWWTGSRLCSQRDNSGLMFLFSSFLKF